MTLMTFSYESNWLVLFVGLFTLNCLVDFYLQSFSHLPLQRNPNCHYGIGTMTNLAPEFGVPGGGIGITFQQAPCIFQTLRYVQERNSLFVSGKN